MFTRFHGLVALCSTLLASPVFAQMVWTQQTPAVKPSVREAGALANDAARGEMVLFGGIQSGGYLADTWTWDGTNWTKRAPATSPPSRFQHRVAYDAQRQRIVLFGGDKPPGNGQHADTWEWDGNDWTQRKPTTSPPARAAHCMVYDAARARVVLFGGRVWRDTWEWDGTTWTQCFPSASPPAGESAMAYDAARQRTILFATDGGTWEWDGMNWTRRWPRTSPPARMASRMTYDAARRRVVIFGGLGFYDDTWEWDGTTWTLLNSASKPSPRYNFAFAYDPRRARVLLFGGYDRAHRDDTWELHPPVSLVGSGTARPGSRVDLTLAAALDVGLPYQVASSFGTGPIKIGTRTLGLGVDKLLEVSVGGVLPTIFVGYQVLIGTNGQAAAKINLPNIPLLVGNKIHTAFVTVSSKSPQGIKSISNTYSFTIVK